VEALASVRIPLDFCDSEQGAGKPFARTGEGTDPIIMKAASAQQDFKSSRRRNK
jgi:hypothetical protein